MAVRAHSKSLYMDVRSSWCKGCGICIAFCPKGVLAADRQGRALIARPELCIGCGICENLCPDFAISLEVKNSA
ncbi:4Fe-4S dicluster domain-containing protein [Calderihabitans maritimus]|uniref:4Fe-4S ferredoxin-type domain-containing protein n=1 Tax=Calderihabitans maritimus TaxID=1246530 RepID=A0A1Z5HRN4_9FIRM|nr:4Fe-4S binding protein [Calderihabitans maritimus]GAW91930.1 hypothetical protein Desor_4063 [Calderihabitans maritimus]